MEAEVFPSTAGIYCIQNTVNGQQYIGSAVNLYRRRWEHLKDLRDGKHYNQHLQRSFSLHGEHSFVWSILDHVADVKDLIAREQHYIDTLRPEYNVAPKAGSFLGFKRSQEWIEATRKRNTGRTHTPEVRARLSAAHKGRKQSPELIAKRATGLKGHKVSDEARMKISAAAKKRRGPNLGKKFSPETRAKISAAQKGRRHSEETIAKLRAISTGRIPSDEARSKMSAAKKGKPKSPEHAAKVNESNRGRKRSEEARARMREAWVRRKSRQVEVGNAE